MNIEKNLKYILEEYEVEETKLERLNKFILSDEFKLKTDDMQKELIMKKFELLKNYIAVLKEQIKYDKELLENEACYISKDGGSYEELEKKCIK
ncbi:hypothetical protein [Fusobacterium sp.]|uniref:hypothetical protein n=1 Tax=Fusobacterium sp. TaxID=68766 RepID=UPI0029008ECC|nr:hypothetical protein [Fusobacterium sp.]MDU1910438.1 hypothetical protein [Fusobacterium sp.]